MRLGFEGVRPPTLPLVSAVSIISLPVSPSFALQIPRTVSQYATDIWDITLPLKV